jgi:hypothetical protein
MYELFEQLESAEAGARLGLNSGFRTFLNAVNGEPAVRQLSEHVKRSARGADLVFSRLTRLAEEQIDPRYEHPRDAAMAAYLLILSIANEGLHRTAADVVLRASNTWWAKRVAEAGRIDTQTTATSPVQTGDFREVIKVAFDSQSHETLIPARVTYSGLSLFTGAPSKDAVGASMLSLEDALRSVSTKPTSTSLTLAA